MKLVHGASSGHGCRGAGGGRQGACRSEGGVQCVRLRGSWAKGVVGWGGGGHQGQRETEGERAGEVGATVLFVQLFRSC